MTTFTAIQPSELQAGKPITEALMTRFASNCLAIQEGDPTAPKISRNALAHEEISTMHAFHSTAATASITINIQATGARSHLIFYSFRTPESAFGPASLLLNGSIVRQYRVSIDEELAYRGWDVFGLNPGNNTFLMSGFSAVSFYLLELKR